MTPKVLREVAREAATRAGIENLAPHDLWRTCARLCFSGGELGSDSVLAWPCFHVDRDQRRSVYRATQTGSKGNWLEERAEALTIRQRVRGPSFPAPFDPISDPQIPLTRHKFDGYSFTVYRHDSADPGSIADNYILSLYEDRAGTLWVGTNKGGLNRFDPRTEQFTRYVNAPNDPGSLSLNAVNMVVEDQSGALWVATDGGGLNRLDRQTGKFTRFINDPTTPDNRRLNIVNVLYFEEPGTLWLGTSLGLIRFDPQTNQVKRFVHDPTDPHSLSHNRVQAIAEDPTGALWVGTPEGLNRFDRATGRLTRFLSDPRQPDSLSHNNIQSLYTDRAGTVWVGTLEGLSRLDLETGRFTRFISDPGNPSSLRTSKVLAIYEDRGGILRVATQDGGLNRFDRKQKPFTNFAHDPQNPHGLGHKIVTTFWEDRAGTLWVGTGGGLDQFDRATQQFTRYTEKDGLPNNNVMGMLEDDHGNLWLGTLREVSRFDPKTKTFWNYDVTDGLRGNEVGQGAYYKNSWGEMFFGGPEGFTAFHPESIKDDLDVPPVVITACRRYNTDDAEGVAVVERGISAQREIEFSYKDDIISFEFAALSFRQPEKNQYAYRLEGYSDKWIQLGTKHDVTFTNLDPGAYTLRVRGSNGDGVWNTTGASLRLIIVPPFWQRWWFVGLELAAAIGLALCAYRWRIRALERRNEQQQAFSRQLIESQESERKRIAAELHDGLGQNLLVVKNRALLGLLHPDNGAHAVTQLHEISTAVSQSLDEVRQIAANLHPYQLDRLGLTKAIEAMIRKVAAAAELEITAEIDNIDGLFDAAAEINLYRVVQESLNNIVKHSAAASADVFIKRTAQGVVVAVHDNGQGFAAGDLKSGFGLTGIAERVRMLGGVHTIDSTPGKGTTVRLTIGLTGNGKSD